MLLITVGNEAFDEDKEEFLLTETIALEMEHSLVSLSKWEAKFGRPFLEPDEKTKEEIVWYIWFMLVTPDQPFDVLAKLSQSNFDLINEYINSTQSATTFGKMPKTGGVKEIVTSELIYYWMVAFNIPFECQTWHLNRLFSLIRICNVKNQPPKKMSASELAHRNRELNKRRKAELGTTG